MPKKKKIASVLQFADLTPGQRHRVATWIADRLGEMEGEEESIAEEAGADFLPALRAVAEHLRV